MTPITNGTNAEESRVPDATARAMLAVLFLVSILNFMDRQIITILLGEIKTAFKVTDAQLGLLSGTVFSAFYTVFGIPLGVYADRGSRRALIGWGLGLWSVMTGLCGFASSFPALAIARMGVGIGEASAAPAAYSLIAEAYPREKRGSALGLYSLGIYIGIGLSTFVGGLIVDSWNQRYATGEAPLGMAGWQAAFLVAAIPGLLLVPFVFAIREPARTEPRESAGAARAAFREGLALLPPSSFYFLSRDAVPIAPNVAAFAILSGAGIALSLTVGNPVQWICLGIGLYVVTTLAQRLRTLEPQTHAIIFGTPSLSLATLGFSFLSINGYAMGFFIPVFLPRYHGLSNTYVGAVWGLISAVCGGLGVMTGGYLSDRFRARWPWGRLGVGVMNALLPLPFLIPALLSTNTEQTLLLLAAAQFFAAMWLGAGSSTVQDLVLPRMRARASAVFILFINLISLALGPYVVGRLSDHWGSLRDALIAASGSNLVALGLFALASRTIARDEATKEARAAAAQG